MLIGLSGTDAVGGAIAGGGAGSLVHAARTSAASITVDSAFIMISCRADARAAQRS
ncbi:MAG: hypothetical protein JO157_00165 [Acetobacteraceae bacterium]|nr:hypothetical protein [Acetobacteraceae bacterium]